MPKRKQQRTNSRNEKDQLSAAKNMKANLTNNVKVLPEEYGLTYATIETDSVSSCHFILMDGKLNDTSFAYLSHYSTTYQKPHNPETTLIDLLKTMSSNIFKHKSSQADKPNIEIIKTKNLRLIVGGGVDNKINLIREGLSLLNNNNINIEHQLEDDKMKHLYKSLRGNVIILPPITYLLNDRDEDKDYVSSNINSGVIKLENPAQSLEYLQRVKANALRASCRFLRKYGHNLINLAQTEQLDPVLGFTQEIQTCIQILTRRTKNNIVLIGDPRVRNTSIIHGLAQRIVRQDVPDIIPKHLIALNMQTLVAGVSCRSEFEERFKLVLNDIENSNSNIILFIDEIHLILGAEKTRGVINAENLLKFMLAQGKFRCIIGAKTFNEYKKYIANDQEFEKYSKHVVVKEPTITDCVSMLCGLKHRIQSYYRVLILNSALVTAAGLSNHYMTNRFLPDKATDLIDEACTSVRVQIDSQSKIFDQLEYKEMQLNAEVTALLQEEGEASKERVKQAEEELKRIAKELEPFKLRRKAGRERVDELRKLEQNLEDLQVKIVEAEQAKNLALVAYLKNRIIPDLETKIAETEHRITVENKQQQDQLLMEVVGSNSIAEIVSRWTGIPVSKLSQTERDRLLKLSEHLHQNVVGQDEAVDSVVEAILRSRAGFSKQHQPIISFLLLGPNSVGKTQLAKALALELFDSTKSMIRIDMSRYTDSHSIARLISAPPGYVTFEQGGQLIEAVRQQPYSVILFDEVEKAHPRFWDALLQVLDDNRLTDQNGQIVSFTNTIILFTSNIDAQFILKENQNLSSITENFDSKLFQTTKDFVMKEIRLHYPTKFLNRLNDIIFFQPFTINQFSYSVHLQLKLIEQFFKELDITINLTDKAVQSTFKKSYNSVDGADLLKEYFEKHIKAELSKLITQMKLVSHSHVTIDTNADDQYQFIFNNQQNNIYSS